MHILLVFLITMLSAVAEAATVNLLGRTIEIVIPAGHCEVGGHPAEAELVRRTKEGIGNSNQILVLFAECKELEDFRRGRRTMMDNYGQILVQTPKGQLRAIKGVSRAKYIQEISAKSNWADAFKKAEARVKQHSPGYQSQENLGLISTDANGLYMGMLGTLTDDKGRPRQIIGVVGMTLVKELSISINLYQGYRKVPDLRGILARQQSAMANFVRANN
ncbi:MAG: hypothetical protein WCO53_11300 [Deltaproteobacteria bacterium]